MYWELMRYGRQRGALVFDFGRSKRDTGPYHFKRHWGFTPEPVRYRVWTSDGLPAPMHRAEAGRVQVLRRAWRRLPLPLTRLLGPALVRHLGVYYT
jgi:CelD/BcsL family acetyltransferase involved in cellulose biosynthesis